MRTLKFRIWSESDKKYRDDLLSELIPPFITADYNDEGDRFDIEQYTGLKDRNGKEIYEGDIVRRKKEGEFETVGVVEWRENGAMFWIDRYYFMSKDGLEVIGNIHENPELLEGDKDD